MAWDSPVWSKINGVMTNEFPLILGGVVYGHLPSGKNNYRLDLRRQNSFMLKNKEVEAYEKDFTRQIGSIKNVYRYTSKGPKFPIPKEEGKKKVDLALMVKVFFQSYRRDVDTILFCDLLQKCEVIENDRAIRVKIINGVEVDPKNPRVEFRIYRLSEGGF